VAIAFVLASTEHGSMIINRFDGGGAGDHMFADGVDHEVQLLMDLFAARRTVAGDGILALDVGANIGTYTVPWAAAMIGWGSVVAFEPQERIYYALAGNIALNNCFNARAIWAAISDRSGTIKVPRLDYCSAGHFGSLSLGPEMRKKQGTESFASDEVPCVRIDEFNFPRVDAIKIDVEGMEGSVLAGAHKTIARCRPIIMAEHCICGIDTVMDGLPDYWPIVVDGRTNMLALPKEDPLWERIKL
jgi:FkbM family methyltransferase